MLAQQPFLLHSPDGQACPPATPAPAALAWVRARTGGRVLSAEPLAAGAVHHNVAITVDGNPPLRVVLRWSAEQRPQDDAPREAILREAAVLSLLERAGLRAPRLVAADPIGAECGVPTLLMTYLEGRQPDADTARSPDFVAQLAAAAHDIHGVDGTGAAAGALAPFRLYNDLVDPRPPRHSDRPALWERAFAAVPVGAPAAPAVFLHRDYHAGNTLWSGSTLSGVVDWNTASLGRPASTSAICAGTSPSPSAGTSPTASRPTTTCSPAGSRLTTRTGTWWPWSTCCPRTGSDRPCWNGWSRFWKPR